MDLRWMLVVGIYIQWGLSGATQMLAPGDGRVSLVVAITTPTLIVVWCTVDARRRGHPIVRIVQMIMWMTWPVAAPTYLVWSRRWLGVGLSVLHFLGYLVAFVAGSALALAFATG